MDLPLKITFRGMEHSDAIEELVTSKAEKLSAQHRSLNSCRVILDSSNKHKNHGRSYEAHIDFTVKGEEFAARASEERPQHVEALQAAITKAFANASRILADFEDKKHQHHR